MILSKKHKFLFIKTRKTAGTSIEIALSKICGQNDIITPITPIDERLRFHATGRICQNYSNNRSLEKIYRKTIIGDQDLPIKIPNEVLSQQMFYNHMPISEVFLKTSYNCKNYFKFTVERHPYDKAISLANYRMIYEQYSSGITTEININNIPPIIDHLIKSGRMEMCLNSHKMYSINGKPMVNKILRFENISKELNDLLKLIGVAEKIDLPFTKVGIRNKNVPASDILTLDQKIYIQNICRAEFNLMSYEAQ